MAQFIANNKFSDMNMEASLDINRVITPLTSLSPHLTYYLTAKEELVGVANSKTLK